MYQPYLFTLFICLVMGVALLFFTIHHLGLIKSGRTTAENIKVGDILRKKLREFDNIQAEIDSLTQPNDSGKKNELLKKQGKLTEEIYKVDEYGKKGLQDNLKEVFSL